MDKKKKEEMSKSGAGFKQNSENARKPREKELGSARRLSSEYRDWFYQEGFFEAQKQLIDIMVAKKTQMSEPMDMIMFTTVVRKMFVREMAKSAGIELVRNERRS